MGRARRPAGPAVIPPTVPATPRERREKLKATYRRLARLAATRVADLVDADADKLHEIVETVATVDGHQGDARRLVMKVLRLRA